MSALPSGASERNEYPMADGLLYYFPAALAAVARVSKIGNDQHNPGEPMHWARGKSTDHANKIIRHQLDAGTMDGDGTRHSAKVAWRALAQLQEELEREEGAPLPRNARLPAHADIPAKSPHDDFIIAQDPPDYPHGWLQVVPAESSYLASFGPNADMSKKSPKADTRVASVDELAGLREHLTAEQLREYGIGDVPHRPHARNTHPMAAEALRDHDERLFGGEDRL